MKILIDIREKRLYDEMLNIQKKDEKFKSICIETNSLELGDVMITSDDINVTNCSDILNGEIILIERKTITDLAASIVDGRYKEQSLRLGHYHIPNHNICYLLEGDIKLLNSRFHRVKPGAIYSSMIVLQYFKGFSVMRTMSIYETAEYILRITEKVSREKNKLGYYHGNHNVFNSSNYTSCIKKTKKDNITPDNIGIILLNQLPGISDAISSSIMEKFTYFDNLLETMKKDNTCLNDIKYNTKTNSQRKISSSVINTIFEYLIPSSNIHIDTP